MSRTTTGFTTRRLLAAGLTAATLFTVFPAAAYAAPAAVRTPATAVLAADPEAQKWAVADKFGLGHDDSLLLKPDRDFVIAIWNHIKDNPDHREVRVAAEQAFSTGDEACNQFIVTDAFAAFDRDIERRKRETENKRASDTARTAAASAVNIVADKTLLDATDRRFAELIWEAVKDQRDNAGDPMWPTVKAAAEDARTSEAKQRDFIATGLAAAAKQDLEDRIAKDKATSDAQKAEARARAAKKSAAERIGMRPSEELLNLPYRDFVITVAEHAAEDSQVQIAAFKAYRSLTPADWETFVTTGIHQAADRDKKIIDDKQAAKERRLVEELLARTEKAGLHNLPQAARKALTGTPQDIAEFLYDGQYKVTPDLPDALHGTVRFGRSTGYAGKCLDIANSNTADGTPVQLHDCNGSAAQDVTSPGDGTMRLLGKCLDAGGPPTGGAPGDRYIQLWTCNSTPTQQWHHRPDGSMYQPPNDRCIDAPGNNNGARLYLHTCHRGENQKWTIAAHTGARFGKITGIAGKCIDALRGANADRTPVTLYHCNGGAAQDITLPGNDTLHLLGKCIDSSGPVIGNNGARLVYLWTCNGSPAQKWTQSPDGTLYNEWTKFCLDVPNSNNSTQLYVHPCNAGPNQRWVLPKAN